ncbi:hypothetical protein AB6A40_002508 [Gnathostoma spinigerum]|uniref:Cystinosin n=1 Tax=Gnathostoma spinigerum TaxID=75299 RepID=A0ABD6EEL2_9BILA
MAFFIFVNLSLLLIHNAAYASNNVELSVDQEEVTLVRKQLANVTFYVRGNLTEHVELTLRRVDPFDATPHMFVLDKDKHSQIVTVSGVSITSWTVLEFESCKARSAHECPFKNLNQTFVGVHVVHSNALSVTVIIVGWIYFIAWSVSFYPQILLNIRRKSVVGLNFDFLTLNIIGFTCYAFYNCLMYFDENIHMLYEEVHPHSLNPVLLNDVVFAVHALFACIVTAFQCMFYQRGGQNVSFTCIGISSLFILFSLGSLIATLAGGLNALQFINNLSYIKMAVTCCKYFPQAIFNFRRKSTIGWSIGNILLDFTGGTMDILQMILQASNTNDWSIFYGNPVKFGLGLVSMAFDILFIVQHYILYPNHTESTAVVVNEDNVDSVDSTAKKDIESARNEDGNASSVTSQPTRDEINV